MSTEVSNPRWTPLRHLAAAINREHAAAIEAARTAVEHAVRCGQLLIKAKSDLGHGEWLPWLKGNCSAISERTAQAYMRLAREIPRLDPAKAQRVADLPLRQALAAVADERLSLPAIDAFNNSLSDEWYTPQWWIGLARAVMGSIDTDPATTKDWNDRVIHARIFYTKDNSGLKETNPWRGNVWLNPPWGRGEESAGAFIKRLEREVCRTNVQQFITCLNLASMSTKWFRNTLFLSIFSLHCVANGRPDFYTPNGEPDSSANHGFVFSYHGNHRRRFATIFGAYGQILERRPESTPFGQHFSGGWKSKPMPLSR